VRNLLIVPGKLKAVLQIRGPAEAFHHTDCNRLRRIGEATPAPFAR
jgi:hypothetical protein